MLYFTQPWLYPIHFCQGFWNYVRWGEDTDDRPLAYKHGADVAYFISGGY